VSKNRTPSFSGVKGGWWTKAQSVPSNPSRQKKVCFQGAAVLRTQGWNYTKKMHFFSISSVFSSCRVHVPPRVLSVKLLFLVVFIMLYSSLLLPPPYPPNPTPLSSQSSSPSPMGSFLFLVRLQIPCCRAGYSYSPQTHRYADF